MAYPGGKSGAGVYQTLINLMPPHDVYVEPFLGGGAVMRLKRPARVNVGIDADAGAIAKLSGVRSPIESSRSPIAAVDEDAIYRGEFQAVSGSYLIHRDAFEFLASWADRGVQLGDVLIYCDPPYVLSTRGNRTYYDHEMTDDDHVRLLRILKELNCRVMISGYSSALYARELKGWNATAFQAATRGKPAAEWVWHNFDRPVELHDYRFLGADFRERERIKRKQRRWKAKLAAMPLLERQALLSVIAEAK